VLVGESGRKMVKHCIIKIFVIFAIYFEGDKKKKNKIKEDRECDKCGRGLERKRLLW